jgi:hypothetical protein
VNETHSFADFEFLACSGANINNVTDDQVYLNESPDPAFANADLVSVTVGGDQNHAFFTVVALCVYAIRFGLCDAALASASYTINNDVYGPIATLFQKIETTAAPNARVVVLAYPRIWSATGNTCQDDSEHVHILQKVPMENRQAMDTLIDEMNTKLEQRAQTAGFVFVDTNDAWDGHRLCDNTTSPWFQYDILPLPWAEAEGIDLNEVLSIESEILKWLQKWLKSLPNLAVFHPTVEGHQVLAQGVEAGAGCLGHIPT